MNFFLFNILNININKALGAPIEGQLLFQTPASPFMEGIVDLHHYIMFFLVFIFVFVFWLIIAIMFSFNAPEILIRSEKLLCANFISTFASIKLWWGFHSLLPFNFYNRFPRFGSLKPFLFFLDFNSSLFNLFRYSTWSQYIRYKHGTIIEFVWTVFPCLILLFIAVPSYRLLFAAEDVVSMHHTIKVIGHQWYWTYEYTYVLDQIKTQYNFLNNSISLHSLLKEIEILQISMSKSQFDALSDSKSLQESFILFSNIQNELEAEIFISSNFYFLHSFFNNQQLIANLQGFNLVFDEKPTENLFIDSLNFFFGNSFIIKSVFITSYMLSEADLPKGGLRLLDVDNVLRVPAYTHLHFLVTSSDVIHSWAVPSLGIKIDAVPGRLNENVTYIARPGVFYGQCSEICGVNHAFMPICVVAYNPY